MSIGKKCPICGLRPAMSPHHIIPRSEGGTDDPKNIVHLCKVCHDIVEEIYNSTGLTYSPCLINAIRREFNFTSREHATLEVVTDKKPISVSRSLIKQEKTEKVKIEGAMDISIRCPYCKEYHFPNKKGVVRCPKYNAKTGNIVLTSWSLESHAYLGQKRVYASTTGQLYTIEDNVLYHYIHNRSIAKPKTLEEFLEMPRSKVTIANSV